MDEVNKNDQKYRFELQDIKSVQDYTFNDYFP